MVEFLRWGYICSITHYAKVCIHMFNCVQQFDYDDQSKIDWKNKEQSTIQPMVLPSLSLLLMCEVMSKEGTCLSVIDYIPNTDWCSCLWVMNGISGAPFITYSLTAPPSCDMTIFSLGQWSRRCGETGGWCQYGESCLRYCIIKIALIIEIA